MSLITGLILRPCSSSNGAFLRNLPIRATRLRTVIPCALRRARDDGQGLRRRLQRIRIERQVAQALAGGTVQAPHSAWPQPNLVPVMPRSRSRRSVQVEGHVSSPEVNPDA